MARKLKNDQVLVGRKLYSFTDEATADRFLACLKTTPLEECEIEVRALRRSEIHPDPASDVSLDTPS